MKIFALVLLIGCGVALIVKGVNNNKRIQLQAAQHGLDPKDSVHYLDAKIQPFAGATILIITVIVIAVFT